eukprot:TRINITY_DN10245_c0_g1_i1.p1 TRINITY_DN10245_c0_g1~~TRINITY_DN10245_c0_g1_i1.p1  ORF type:complete len:1160 (-),score=267.08 TRINITY_DN10245_c0_g1_i1:126-3122(-)
MLIYFLDPPELDMEFRGALRIADFPGIKSLTRWAMQHAISESMVLPSALPVALGTPAQGIDRAFVKAPRPVGAIRATAVRAEGLRGANWRLFRKATSDPYLNLRLSNMSWRSSVVSRNCDPVWPEGDSGSMPIYDSEQQLWIDVYDSNFGRDELLGTTRPLPVQSIEALSDVPIPIYQNNEACGTVTLRFELLDLRWDLRPDEYEEAFVEVTVDKVLMPDHSKDRSVSFRARLENYHKATPAGTEVRRKAQAIAARARALSGLKGRAADADGETAEVEELLEKHMIIEHTLYLPVMNFHEKHKILELEILGQNRTVLAERKIDVDDIRVGAIGGPEHLPLELHGHGGRQVQAQVMLSLVGLVRRPSAGLGSKMRSAPGFAGGSAGASSSALGASSSPSASSPSAAPRQLGAQMSKLPSAIRAATAAAPSSLPRGALRLVASDDRFECLDSLMARLWPHIDKAVQQVVFAEVTSKVRSQLPQAISDRFRFDHFTLGRLPPKLGPLDVVERETYVDGATALELRLHVELDSDCHISVSCGNMGSGIRSLRFSGDLFIRLEPILPELPVIGGVLACFLDPPKVEFEFDGLARIAELPGISGAVRSAINSAIADNLVIPNVLACSMASEDQGVDLMAHRPFPMGVLTVWVKSASGLTGHNWHLFSKSTCDTFVKLRFAASECRTSTVKGTTDPVWPDDEAYSFIVFDMEQRLWIDVYDDDHLLGSADFVGHTRPLGLQDALRGSADARGQRLPLYGPGTDVAAPRALEPPAEARCGEISVHCQWQHLFGGHVGDALTLVVVAIEEVSLPEDAGAQALLQCSFAGELKTTPVVSHRAAPQLTPQQEERILKLSREEGRSAAGVAAELGFSLQDVERVLRLHADSQWDVQLQVAADMMQLALDVEHRMFFLATSQQIDSETLELAILGRSVLPLGTLSIPLRDVASDEHCVYPSGADGCSVDGLRCGAAQGGSGGRLVKFRSSSRATLVQAKLSVTLLAVGHWS